MARAIALHLLLFWGVAAAEMLGLWLWARRVGNAAWVDVGWSASFALGVAAWSIAWPGAPAPLAIMVACWSVRLADGRAITRTVRLPGDRADIRDRSTTVAMHLLHRLLSE